ncbi:Sigma-70, region 4 [Desulfotomaculum arcticum]|uniref:Sigma-70, region 4 n=1 Tax=Desulfotruncus arcticus DSM 17038 TaxID=1121424 RepID=A0A1I2Y039_9FIRM|nr:sigma factor-like helix-turn-helix DNA-binding protein [Desulfotruncus arcticus]SFH19002.1 Sigma-70, region 4 [Desulfotomaculum arcticum] [Desulfotruncus arcticus DSM 17038]
MARLTEIDNFHDTPKKVFNCVYNICFRLTGNHVKAGELVKATFIDGGYPIDPIALITVLCASFISWSRADPGTGWYLPGLSLHQQALLQLAPLERLVVVLHDVAGFDYDEIARVTGFVRSDVAKLLASGRLALRDKLIPSRSAGESKPGGLINAG